MSIDVLDNSNIVLVQVKSNRDIKDLLYNLYDIDDNK